MVPARENFEAVDRAGTKVYQWLEIRNKLVAFNRTADVLFSKRDSMPLSNLTAGY